MNKQIVHFASLFSCLPLSLFFRKETWNLIIKSSLLYILSLFHLDSSAKSCPLFHFLLLLISMPLHFLLTLIFSTSSLPHEHSIQFFFLHNISSSSTSSLHLLLLHLISTSYFVICFFNHFSPSFLLLQWAFLILGPILFVVSLPLRQESLNIFLQHTFHTFFLSLTSLNLSSLRSTLSPSPIPSVLNKHYPSVIRDRSSSFQRVHKEERKWEAREE